MVGRRRVGLIYFLFCVPALLIYFFFWGLPGIENILISLTSWATTGALSSIRFVGLANYVRLVQDPLFWNALKNNMILAAVTVVAVACLALFMAVLIERSIPFGKGFFRSVFFFARMLPGVVIAFLWGFLYNPTFGILDVFLKSIGFGFLAADWLGNPRIALYSLSAVGVWQSVGFYLVIFIAGLQGVPRELEEAAYVDGATPTQSFFRIVLPLLRPIVGIVVTMILIDAFRLFETVLIMTQGGPGYWSTDVLGYYIYREAFSNLNLSYGATIAVALLVAVAALSVVSFRFTTKRVD